MLSWITSSADLRNRMFSSRRPLLLLCPLVALFTACAPNEAGNGETTPEASGPRPRHVLMIVIDTLRADHLSCYGYWRETSPNIDSMAKRGVQFSRAISQSSWTSPSMITMMTGQRVAGDRLSIPDEKPVLAELFKDAGYRTGAWVANELLDPENGFARGFDRYVGPNEWHSTKPPGRTDGIVEWLKENEDRDTFTWVHFTDPHDPYTPATDFKPFGPGRIPEHQEKVITEIAEAHEFEAALPQQLAHMTRQLGQYDDEVRRVDRKVRDLLVALHESGNLENAVVVLTSDHGECLWERPESKRRLELRDKHRKEDLTVRHLFKQTHGDFVTQELIRVPLIIMAPSIEKRRVENMVAEAVHLPSTLLELAGVEVAGTELLAGTSLFGGEIPPGAYSMTALSEAFVAEDGWKLILPTESGANQFDRVVKLHDLNTDPREQTNLASEHPDRVTEMTARIAERRQGALPKLLPQQRNKQLEENADAIDDNGYGGGDFLDLGDGEDE